MRGHLPWTDLFDQCCINTTFAHTLYSYSSQLVISKGSHLIKFGGEQRIFYNNFFQPPNPTGLFTFTDYVTSPTPNSDCDPNCIRRILALQRAIRSPACFLVTPTISTPLLSLIVYSLGGQPVAETGFYIQDDWKVNSKFTLNLGLRYQWSTPYTERHNRIEFSNFTADTGVNLDLSSAQCGAAASTMQ